MSVHLGMHHYQVACLKFVMSTGREESFGDPGEAFTENYTIPECWKLVGLAGEFSVSLDGLTVVIAPDLGTLVCEMCKEQHLQEDDYYQCACGLLFPGCWEDEGHPCSGCDESLCSKCIESSPDIERCESCVGVFHVECWEGERCDACSATRCRHCESFASCSVCARPNCSACSEALTQHLVWDDEGATATCSLCAEEAQDEKDRREEKGRGREEMRIVVCYK